MDLPVKVSCECYEALKQIRQQYGKTKKFAVEEALKEKYPELFEKGE